MSSVVPDLASANGIAGIQLDPARWRALASAGRPVTLTLHRGATTLEAVVAPATLVK